jgi:hypothetical protein
MALLSTRRHTADGRITNECETKVRELSV